MLAHEKLSANIKHKDTVCIQLISTKLQETPVCVSICQVSFFTTS